MRDYEDIETKLQQALAECASLREENERLKKLLGLSSKGPAPIAKPVISDPPIPYLFGNALVANSSSIENMNISRVRTFRIRFFLFSLYPSQVSTLNRKGMNRVFGNSNNYNIMRNGL
ncbi:hypothetical protein [Candidatus Hakubella thermalkaliphila]|uniref:Uncharacterized protein n=1 Tax=Candidatus Hakubella thermalkaliphila TaxID=2754717 RepID=A0A6V8P2L7_9ACTN|nr:hypothetical protein [Candidatus Hakubella thermalkaliphila]GFP26795.1 hypothetical protein HKBW3S33_00209 [Candidatus Hakubella thermalkaliphila]